MTWSAANDYFHIKELLMWYTNATSIVQTLHDDLDCKTVGFFSKSVKKSATRGVRALRARSARASHARSVSPQSRSQALSLALRLFSACSRPFVWLPARTWIRKNTDCFAVQWWLASHAGVFRGARFSPSSPKNAYVGGYSWWPASLGNVHDGHLNWPSSQYKTKEVLTT